MKLRGLRRWLMWASVIFIVSAGMLLTRWSPLSLHALASLQPRAIITASGTIEAEEVKISSERGGRVLSVTVNEVDPIEEGQLLVQLDDSLLVAQMGEAEAAVVAARAMLAETKAGPRPSEIAAARAEVARAEAELAGARDAYQHAQEMLKTPHDLIAQIDDARARIALAKAQIGQAQARYGTAQALRDGTTGGSDYDKTKRVVYEQQMIAAQAAIEAAQEAEKGAEATLAALEAIRRNPLALIAEVQGEAVAALVLFHFGAKAWYMQGMSRPLHREKSRAGAGSGQTGCAPGWPAGRGDRRSRGGSAAGRGRAASGAGATG